MLQSETVFGIERLREIRKKVATPLVLHGGSGLSDDDFRNTVKEGIAKVNIFTDLWYCRQKTQCNTVLRTIFLILKQEAKRLNT